MNAQPVARTEAYLRELEAVMVLLHARGEPAAAHLAQVAAMHRRLGARLRVTRQQQGSASFLPNGAGLPADLRCQVPRFTASLGPPGARGVTSEGLEVGALQRLLRMMGLSVSATGRFDETTRRAVKELQRNHGLPPDGLVGQATRRLLNSLRLDVPS